MPRKKAGTSRKRKTAASRRAAKTQTMAEVRPTNQRHLRIMRVGSFAVFLLGVMLIVVLLFGYWYSYYFATGTGVDQKSETSSSKPSVVVEDVVGYEGSGTVADDLALVESGSLVVRTGTFDMTVNNTEEVVRDVEAIADDLDGSVISSYVSDNTSCRDVYYEETYSSTTSLYAPCTSYGATVVIEVPSDKFTEARDAIELLDTNKKFDSASTSSDDVTDQVIDLEARLKSLRAEEAALQALLETATSVDDILEIRTQLTTVRTQIESYDASLKNLEDRVQFAQITLTITEPAGTSVTDTTSVSDTFSAAWEQAKADLRLIGEDLVYLVVYAIIYLPVAALVFLVIWAVRRMMRPTKKK